MATGQEGTFGESGERISAAVEETPSDSRELLARVDFAPDTDAGMESMLGFRQDLGFAGSVQSVAAVAIHPEIDSSRARGWTKPRSASWETIHLGDEFEAEAGSEQVLARFAQRSPNTIAAALPFATVPGATAIPQFAIAWQPLCPLHPILTTPRLRPGCPQFPCATDSWRWNMACTRRLAGSGAPTIRGLLSWSTRTRSITRSWRR